MSQQFIVICDLVRSMCCRMSNKCDAASPSIRSSFIGFNMYAKSTSHHKCIMSSNAKAHFAIVNVMNTWSVVDLHHSPMFTCEIFHSTFTHPGDDPEHTDLYIPMPSHPHRRHTQPMNTNEKHRSVRHWANTKSTKYFSLLCRSRNLSVYIMCIYAIM